MVDGAGKHANVVCTHDLPQKLLAAGLNIGCLGAWATAYNTWFSVPKHKRENSRIDGRKARHTNPVETSFLRANLPSMKTLVISFFDEI